MPRVEMMNDTRKSQGRKQVPFEQVVKRLLNTPPPSPRKPKEKRVKSK